MTEVRWLTDEQQRVWRSFLAVSSTLREHLDRQLSQEAGIPHTYYEILVMLSESEHRSLRMSDLAMLVHSSRSRLSHAVARLEQKGWVARSSCGSDRRGSFARLTDEGLAALEAAAPGHVAAVREHLFDPLTDDQVAALGDITDAIQAGFQTVCQQVREEQERAESADDGAPVIDSAS